MTTPSARTTARNRRPSSLPLLGRGSRRSIGQVARRDDIPDAPAGLAELGWLLERSARGGHRRCPPLQWGVAPAGSGSLPGFPGPILPRLVKAPPWRPATGLDDRHA